MKIIATLFLVFLFAGVASANPDITFNTYDTGFSLIPNNLAQTTCLCDNLNDNYIIQNNADYKIDFLVSNNIGLAQNFKQITLEPKQKVLLVLSADLQCNSENFAYSLTVSTNYGMSQTLNRNVIVEKCQNLQLSMNETKNLIPNSTLIKTIQVINTGSFTETYQVSSKRLNRFTKNSSYLVEIPPNSYIDLDFEYNFPPELYGNQTLIFEAEAQTNKLFASLKDEFQIYRDYEFSAESNEIFICTEKNEEFSFYINNDGAITNTYQIQLLNGKDYSLLWDEVTINPDSSAEIKIKPNKNKNSEEILRIKITAKYGDTGTILEIPVSSQNCFNNNYIIPEEIIHCGGEKNYDLIIENNGLLDSKVFLWTNQGELSEREVKVSAGEKETLELEIASSEENTFLSISAEQGNESFEIPTFIQTNCQIPNLLKDHFSSRNEFTQILIPIKNSGMESANYELSVDNDAYLDVDEITIDSGQVVNVLLTVDFSGRDFATYAFNLKLDNQDFQVIIDYKERTLLQKGFDFLLVNTCALIFAILVLIALILLLILVFIRPKGKGSKQKLGIFLFLILLISGSVIYGFKGLPEPLHPELEYDMKNLYFETYSDESLIINVSQYFEDADSDYLNFELNSEDSINYLLYEGILMFNVEEGNYFMTVTASDGKDLAESPEIMIVSKNKEKISLLTFFLKYCHWLNWLMLFIVSFIFFGIVSKSEKKPKKGKFEKPKFDENSKRKTNKLSRKAAKKTTKKKSLNKTKASKTANKTVKKEVSELKPEVKEPEEIKEPKKIPEKKAVKKKSPKKKTSKPIVLEEKSAV